MHVAREPVELGDCETGAQRVRDKAVQRPAILQEDRHIGLPRINTRRNLGEHLAAQRDDSGIRSPVAELPLPARARRDCDGVIDAELAPKAVLRVFLPVSSSTRGCTLSSMRSIWSAAS
jgi:hypothetical protein